MRLVLVKPEVLICSKCGKQITYGESAIIPHFKKVIEIYEIYCEKCADEDSPDYVR